MGFEVTPSKTATLDLTPIKEQEKAHQAKSPARPKAATVHVEETKITTTRYVKPFDFVFHTEFAPFAKH